MGAAQKRSTFQDFVGCLPAAKRPAAADPQTPTEPAKPGRVPVYVMMHLDWMTDCGTALRDPARLKVQLQQLKKAAVAGVMADIWWGRCEPAPGKYCFGGVLELCKLLKEVGLHLQATMSFHMCGGNVGDPVTIPLPTWALEAARENDLLYRHGKSPVSEDCLSLSCDNESLLPGGADGGKRTPLECYRAFIAAFAREVKDFLGTTVNEVQVGMGPCGELRYPSYMMAAGWQFPGVGLVMSDDARMREALRKETGLASLPLGLPSDQNAQPDDVPAFRASSGGKGSANGNGHGNGEECDLFCKGDVKTFLEWYSRVLVKHGEDLLSHADAALREANHPTVALSVKVSGLHWHVLHPSRATEACAGYDNCSSRTANAYDAIAGMIAQTSRTVGRPIFFNFTCLEMTNTDNNNNPQTLSAPEDLIAQVRNACVRHNVPLSGENALEFDLAEGGWAFERMAKQMRGWSPGRDKMHAVTLLRLNDSWKGKALTELAGFVSST